ncbi:MAG: glycosyltransferase family 1 protein [Candidatus Poseidoniales archaeon]|nr:MAG: hypothetical protein CBE15_06885 [Euryarchaeota archaeon TMED255]RAH11496.1 MAG: hypothetical protein CMA23_001960 [Euryarchaeota archaeon]RCH73684.1 MAG: glycosyltransferase family 1 protein [Candidatus Poseidoniales archaeon]|tara:strand:+ start:1699 stop:2934 length:1236 start_codon:yes stop_codon:yes gene_type:complete
MHIAMLSGEYPPRWGGMGSTVFHLSAALVARGHRVTVITRNGGGGPIPKQDGVKVRIVNWAKIPMAFTRSYGKYALNDLTKLHSEDPVDVVHLHCPMISWNTLQFNTCTSKVAPVVSSLHGSWLGERDGLLTARRQREAAVWANPNDLAILLTAGHYARFEKAAIHGSKVCVANSKATMEDFVMRYDPPDNWDCEVVHWGVDTEMFVPIDMDDMESTEQRKSLRLKYGVDDSSNLILAVGRLAARKGYGSLLKAFAKVHETNPDTTLVIVGRGHLRKRLLRQAKRLSLDSSVVIESGMPFEDLAMLFRSANLVVYPSYYEGQGLIPLEAMSSGTPVVTVDHGPLPEMVDNTVGSLFQMGDVDSMAESILTELTNPALLSLKGEAGRKRVLESFTYAHDAERFESIYSRAIE